jgi:hypothetical protein
VRQREERPAGTGKRQLRSGYSIDCDLQHGSAKCVGLREHGEDKASGLLQPVTFTLGHKVA